jgi:hypothetical protein
MQVNTTTEDYDKIRTLQANLQLTLDRWDTTDVKARDFGHLVPVVDELEDALRELLHRRAKVGVARLRRLGGWGGLAAGAVFLALALFGGWNAALLVMTVVAVTSGAVLLIGGGPRV